MLKLALRIVPYITGYVHIQTNPYYAYNTSSTIANAFRLIQITHHLQPTFDTTRLCIKIPATWEGLLACRTLELAGIRTLATTLFTFPQAALAAEVGCAYVAPYVNRLGVHFEEDLVDSHPLTPLVATIQNYYNATNPYPSLPINTKVLAASLTSTQEIFALAGVHHITIPPGLLRELSVPIPVPIPGPNPDADSSMHEIGPEDESTDSARSPSPSTVSTATLTFNHDDNPTPNPNPNLTPNPDLDLDLVAVPGFDSGMSTSTSSPQSLFEPPRPAFTPTAARVSYIYDADAGAE